MIKQLFNNAFYCPKFILILLGAISIIALSAALISQYVFDMMPCILCLYQRIPYAIVILLSLFGYFATKIDNTYGVFNIFLSAIAFLVNSGIASYHVGVEQHWWASACSFADLSKLAAVDMAAAIKSAPAVSCDQIPFELFGISMAGYNVIMCFGLGIYCLTACYLILKNKNRNV